MQSGGDVASRAAGLGPPRPFRLSKWFGLLGLVSIASISALAGYLLSIFVTDRMVQQEGELTMEMVENLILVERPFVQMFSAPDQIRQDEIVEAIDHIAHIPGVLRANVYDRNRRILWSSDAALIGQQFGENDELDEALAGTLVAHGATYEDDGDGKAEHRDLARKANFFVEIYLPVRADGSGPVLGAIEVYKNPVSLFLALQQLYRYIALGAALSGLFLYLTLFWLVRRADQLIRVQQGRLVDAETLAVVGEMSSAVAHGIRNPLASIRSSAELIQVTDEQTGREAAADIIAESDRLEAWVRELLSFSRPLNEKPAPVALAPLVARCMDEFAREFQRREIHAVVVLAPDLPDVRGDVLLLGQVLQSVLANAVEAMERGGRLELSGDLVRSGQWVAVSVRDQGSGMTPEQLQRVGKPFYTTKPRGMGVGLALARRIMERLGGALEIESVAGEGTTVRMLMRVA